MLYGYDYVKDKIAVSVANVLDEESMNLVFAPGFWYFEIVKKGDERKHLVGV